MRNFKVTPNFSGFLFLILFIILAFQNPAFWFFVGFMVLSVLGALFWVYWNKAGEYRGEDAKEWRKNFFK